MAAMKSPRHWLWAPLTGTALLGVPLALVALVAFDADSLSTQRIVTLFFINIVLAVGIQSFIGLSGLISLGHVAFMGIGAYSAGSNPKIDYTLSRIEAVNNFLRQDVNEQVDVTTTLAEMEKLLLDRRRAARDDE